MSNSSVPMCDRGQGLLKVKVWDVPNGSDYLQGVRAESVIFKLPAARAGEMTVFKAAVVFQ